MRIMEIPITEVRIMEIPITDGIQADFLGRLPITARIPASTMGRIPANTTGRTPAK
jgi:hypothetical protein